VKYLKQAVPVAVSFAAAAGEIATLEGPVRCAAGDALMTGVQGEHWPITRAHFEASYEPLVPLTMGQAGLYVKKPLAVEARQLDRATTVRMAQQQGSLHARAGDWLVSAPDGAQWVVVDEIFRQTYAPLSP
jgi:hypothetical protein